MTHPTDAQALPDGALHLPPLTPGGRIGVLGGTFDPAHGGHLELSRTALARLRLDAVWWMVSPGNPLKDRPPAPLAMRLAQARAVAAHPAIHVCAPEGAWGTRATADTLSHLLRATRGAQIVWLMGSDNLSGFHRWSRWRQIARSVPIAVIARPGDRARALLSPAARSLRACRLPARAAPTLPGAVPPAWVYLQGPLCPVSSTALRHEV